MGAAGAVQAEETPATPLRRVVPDYPAACLPPVGETAPEHRVSVVYDVAKDGTPENVTVRESTDPCFEETAIAAVRGSLFEPQRVNGRKQPQEDMETTFRFVFEEAEGATPASATTEVEHYDARPVKRVPPRYPEKCMMKAASRELVLVEFVVTADGSTADATVIQSTNPCLEKAALDSVARWTYEPKMVAGEPVSRPGVQTMIAFELSGASPRPEDQIRPIVWRRLISIQSDIKKKRSPDIILADLAELEAKYGAEFTKRELGGFHQLRAVARLAAKDYAGALDDFRIVLQVSTLEKETRDAIKTTVEQLEAVLAAQDAQQSAQTEQQ
ncbi:MAG: energy transducer TonB [Amphiplicatus sp.]